MFCFWNVVVVVGEFDYGYFGCVGFSYRIFNGNFYVKIIYIIYVSKVCIIYMQVYKIMKWFILFLKC